MAPFKDCFLEIDNFMQYCGRSKCGFEDTLSFHYFFTKPVNFMIKGDAISRIATSLSDTCKYCNAMPQKGYDMLKPKTICHGGP